MGISFKKVSKMEWALAKSLFWNATLPAFNWSKLTIETLEQDVKYVQS